MSTEQSGTRRVQLLVSTAGRMLHRLEQQQGLIVMGNAGQRALPRPVGVATAAELAVALLLLLLVTLLRSCCPRGGAAY